MADVRRGSDFDYSKWHEHKELTRKEAIANWWYYHVWYVVTAAVVVFIALYLLFHLFGIGQTKCDYYITYVGLDALPDDMALAIEDTFEGYGEDLNGDGKTVVELKQYQIALSGEYEEETEDVDEILVNSQNAYYSYLSDMTFAADLSVSGGYIFLLENPDAFQAAYKILLYKDGSEFPEDATDYENCYYSVQDCPVLSSMDLGVYSISSLKGEETGDNNEIFSELYIGRRYFSDLSKCENYEGNVALWDVLTSQE